MASIIPARTHWLVVTLPSRSLFPRVVYVSIASDLDVLLLLPVSSTYRCGPLSSLSLLPCALSSPQRPSKHTAESPASNSSPVINYAELVEVQQRQRSLDITRNVKPAAAAVIEKLVETRDYRWLRDGGAGSSGNSKGSRAGRCGGVVAWCVYVLGCV